MIIGVDFDNTIVSYERVFREAALAHRLVEPGFGGGKRELRDMLRTLPAGEGQWQVLQAEVYGPRLVEATVFPGFQTFSAHCKDWGVPLYLVSHKSAYAAADPSGVNLREAAHAWLARELPPQTFTGMYFEDDRTAKLGRIAALNCTHFIDDLAEVFLEQRFPAQTARMLFDPSGSQPAVCEVERFTDWHDIDERIAAEHRVWVLAASLADGAAVQAVQASGNGGNNAIFRVDLENRRVAMKIYGVPDDRGRMRHEVAAVSMLSPHGLPVPALIARSFQDGAALFEWIEGEPVSAARPGDVAEALDLVARLDELCLTPEASLIEPAAEAGLSMAEVWHQIGTRLTRLRSCAGELEEFLNDFEAAFSTVRAVFRRSRDPEYRLPRGLQTLSPSDFGFHNAVRSKAGLRFLDFEYFGWDDPVKLVADFTLHPGMALRAADIKEWLAGTAAIFGRDADFAARLAACYTTYELKWCLIILNEFRPEIWERRSALRPDLVWEHAKAMQLAKARSLLERVHRGESIGF